MKKNLPILTSLRFFAAFYVFLFHVDMRKPLEFLPGLVVKQGAVGVNVFFILSGFILFYNYFSRNVNFIEFILKRISKIYPVYLVGLFLSGIVYFAFHVKIEYSFEIFMMNLMMVQSYLPSFSMVWYGGGSWSISTEFFFYLCFPILLMIILKLSRNLTLLSLLGVYFFSLLPGILYNMDILNSRLTYTFPLSRIPEFICGMLAAALVFKYRVRLHPILSILTILLCTFFFLFIGQNLRGYTIQNAVVLPVMVALLIRINTTENQVFQFFGNKFFEYLGKISYSFYIIQLPLMLFLDNTRQFKELNTYVFLLMVLAINLLGAIVSYHFVEDPMHKYFNKRIESLYSKIKYD